MSGKNRTVSIKKEDLPKIRKPNAPAQKAFKDKSKYSRKTKHKSNDSNS